MTWTDLVPDRDVFAPYYDEVPELSGVRLRSVHLDAWGSAVTLRLDLPRFPDRWDRGPGDTLQRGWRRRGSTCSTRPTRTYWQGG
ncbi:hypothetical protein ACFYYS_30710 [Streptomyces sp. NPDC002120]|uniref:hypothetical protein n=1 Tax=Streptomyces sp. NPDC002120 TaxID=3364631 RepID=UPI0036C23237